MYPQEYQEQLSNFIENYAENVYWIRGNRSEKQDYIKTQHLLKNRIIEEYQNFTDGKLLFNSYCLMLTCYGNISSIVEGNKLTENELNIKRELLIKAINTLENEQNGFKHLTAMKIGFFDLIDYDLHPNNGTYTFNLDQSEIKFIEHHLLLALTNLRVLDLDPHICNDFFDIGVNKVIVQYLKNTTNNELGRSYIFTINSLFEKWVNIGENMLQINPKVTKMGKFKLDYLDYFIQASDLTIGKLELSEKMLRHRFRTGKLCNEHDGGEGAISIIVDVLAEMQPNFENHYELLTEIIDYLNDDLQWWEGKDLKQLIDYFEVLSEDSIDEILNLYSRKSKFTILNGSWPNGRFAFFDVETTGLHPEGGDRIIEWAVVVIENGVIIDKEQMLVNPLKPIPPMLTQEVHGISDTMVSNKPIFAGTSDRLISMIRNSVIVAHKANFDARFLGYELGKIGKGIQSLKFVDSIKISKYVYPSSSSYKLADLCHQYGIDSAGAHRAMKDVTMMYMLFDEFFKSHRNMTFEKLLEIGIINTPKIELLAACIVKGTHATIGLEYTINYKSSNGELSTRKIRIESIIKKNNDYILEAYCYNRLALRSFLVSRISGIIEE